MQTIQIYPLFNQLHAYGDNLPQNVISVLTEAANKELKSQRFRKSIKIAKKNSVIESLNDDVLCYIGNFLTIEDLYLKFQFLNYHFFKISHNPQTCKIWQLPQIWKLNKKRTTNQFNDLIKIKQYLKNHKPNFSICSNMSILNFVSFDLSRGGLDTLDLLEYYTQLPKKVSICM